MFKYVVYKYFYSLIYYTIKMGDSDAKIPSGTISINTDRKLPGPFQNYKYGAFINSPTEMGMKGETSGWGLDTIGTNFGGLISYIQLLVTGTSQASKAAAIDYPVSGLRFAQPLGNAYTFNTGFKCKDSNGELQDAVAYVNNIPLGNIPFISSFMGAGDISELRGLLPGMFENFNGFNPMIIVNALGIENGDDCNEQVEKELAFSLPVTNINEDGTDYQSGVPPVSYSQLYMFNNMVSEIDPCLFRGTDGSPGSRQNPVTRETCRESFSNIDGNTNSNTNSDINNNCSVTNSGRVDSSLTSKLQNDIQNNLSMLSKLNSEDWIIQLYYISFSILIIFIIIKIMNKKL